MKNTKMLTILVLVLVLATSAVGSTQGKMYWTDTVDQKIQRANLDGSGAEDLFTSLTIPSGIALDVAGGKMYWTDIDALKIQRANLDGSGVEDLVVTGLSAPGGIALDVAGGKMYWVDSDTDKIQRANLDGSSVEDLVTGLSVPIGIALDVAGGKMYWTDYGAGKIQHANLDGSGAGDVVTGLSLPLGIALDVAGGKMYWTDYVDQNIQRANLDGSGAEDLVTGLMFPCGIALDVAGGKIYWTDNNTGKIQCANLDGSTVEDLLTGLSWPSDIAIVPAIYAFSYQGHLYDNNSVADGLYDFAFKLYNASAGSQVGDDVYKADVDVIDGYFAVELDFGEVFNGDGRWLQIGIRPGQFEDPNDYTTLSPRQEVMPTPYAMHSENADTLDDLDSADFASSGHDHDGSDITSGTVDETYIDPDMATDSELSSGLATKADVVHAHDGSDITVGTVADARIADSIARDAEIMPTVLSNDGSGSGLDADMLDGLDESSFASSGHDHDPAYVNETGDSMTGTLTLPVNGLVVGTNQLVTSSGNVGIGTGSPDEKLHISGTPGVDGIKFPDGSVQTTSATALEALIASLEARIAALENPPGWGTAELIETDNAVFQGAERPQIAVDGSGNAVAVWRQSDGTRYNIWSNRYVAGTGWGTAELVETDTGNVSYPQVAADGSGNAIVMWPQDDGTRWNIWSNRYVAGTGWGTAELVETDTETADAPQVAFDPSGNAVAVWQQHDGTRYSICSNRYVAGTGWGTAELIETDNAGSAYSPRVAADGSGNAVAAWRQSDGTRSNIWSNRYVPGTGWGTAELIETNNAGNAYSSQVAVDPSGNAIAVWYQSDGTRYNIWSNRYGN